MSFEVSSWPLPDDLQSYRQDTGLPVDAIVRDIVRIVAIAHMVHSGDLTDDNVVTGGMAMRLRGSPRFTMSDTDTSRRAGEAPDRDALAQALSIDESDLVITPADHLGWKAGKKVVTAQPVNYKAFFAGLSGQPVEDQFTYTVSWRGLIEPAQHLLLVHPYATLDFPRTIVPAMDLTEQLAEKIVGWCAHGLMKHYVDVAWAAWQLPGIIDPKKIGRLVDAKLAVGRELFPAQYAQFPDRAAIRPALENPDEHVPPQGEAGDDKASQIRFAGAGLNKAQAIALMRDRVIPALFP